MIQRLHYRFLNGYIAFYFQQTKHSSMQNNKIMQVTGIKKTTMTKSKMRLIGATA